VGCPRTSSVSRHTGTATSRRPACDRSASGGPQRDSRQRPPSAPASSRGPGGSATRRQTCRTAAPSQRRRWPPRPSLRLRRSPRQSWPWATPTPGRGVAGMASRRTYPPTGRAPGRGSGGASGDALGASVPAFAATPPPSRTPRTRRAPRPGYFWMACAENLTTLPRIRDANNNRRVTEYASHMYVDTGGVRIFDRCLVSDICQYRASSAPSSLNAKSRASCRARARSYGKSTCAARRNYLGQRRS